MTLISVGRVSCVATIYVNEVCGRSTQSWLRSTVGAIGVEVHAQWLMEVHHKILKSKLQTTINNRSYRKLLRSTTLNYQWCVRIRSAAGAIAFRTAHGPIL